MTETLNHPICQRLTWTLLHFVWQGAMVGAVLWAGMAVFRVQKAQVRYVLSLAALCAMGLCPVVTFLAGGRPEAAEAACDMACVSTPVAAGMTGSQGGPVGAAQPPAWGLMQRVQPYVLLAWLGGVCVLGLRMVVGYLSTTWLRRQGRSIPTELGRRVAEIGRALGVNAIGRVLASERVRDAMAVGFWRPVVLFPASWLTELPAHALEAIIAHELAHVRRWDLWASLAQRMVETLLFYHPLVWWLSRRVDLEREMCCDDLAVAAIGERVEYVRALESVARMSATSPAALAASFGGRRKMDLLSRVRYVLGLSSTRDDGRWWPLGLAASVLPLVAWLFVAGLAAPTAGAAEGKGLTAAEVELMKLIGQLRKEVAQLRAEVKALRAERAAREHDRDGDGERRETRQSRRDGDAGRRETRRHGHDGERRAEHGERDGDRRARRTDRDRDVEGTRRDGGDRAGTRPRRRYSKAGKIFTRYDASGDDKVSFEEWLAMKEGEMTDDRRAKERTWYDQADASGDGAITFEEFEGWMASKSRRREGSRRGGDRE